jgi:photosystem II stability/assembly factor-like uncharacterized protein
MPRLRLLGLRLSVAVAVLVPVLAAATLLSGASAGVNTPHSGWYSGNPLLGPNQLNDLACSGRTCYAAGSFGTLLKSTDAGATWTGARTGVTAFLSRVTLAGGDPQRVVAGAGCALRRSDDGGQTFFRLPFAASDAACPAGVTAFAFPTADVGYLFLSGGAVLTTADGGRTFTRRTAVPGAQPTDVVCPAAEVCFVTSGTTIQRTGDGGASWTQVHAGNALLQGIELADPHTLYAVGNGLALLKSEDGGATWRRKPVGAVPLDDLVKVRCGSASTCLIAERGSRLLRTADGGDTFASLVSSDDRPFGIEFASASRALAVGEFGSAEVSDDGGATWRTAGGRIRALFRVLHAASPTVAYAGGTEGALARTVDGGQTWRNVSPPTPTSVLGIAAPTAERVYVLTADGSLQRSDNGGASYKLLSAGRRPSAILAPDASRLLLVGPVGIRRSTDAGERFTRLTARAVRNAVLRRAARAGSTLVAWGPQRLLVSRDGGASWRAVGRPARTTIAEASFASPSIGFVLDGRGRLWRTRSGGRSWAELETLGTRSAYALTFADARNGYVAVASFARHRAGYLLRTTDGGAHWRPQLVDAGLMRAVETSGGTAYALGLSNALYATTSGGDLGAQRGLALSTPRRVLRKPGRVTVGGRLGSAEGGERVAVSILARGRWTQVVATAASNGSFTTRWLVRSRAVFVAQALGDAGQAGAASSALTVVVKKPKRS